MVEGERPSKPDLRGSSARVAQFTVVGLPQFTLQKRSKMPYRVHPAEPGMLMELYLPKLIRHQGKLYDTLNDGLLHHKVKAYLIKNKAYNRKLLFDRIATYDDARAEKVGKVFHGFSVYEVDGVFCSTRNKSQKIIEERTQIVRLLFRPDYEESRALPADTRARHMEYLRRFRQIPLSITEDPIGHFFEYERIENTVLQKELRPILKKVQIWGEDVLYFVFGYLVSRLTQTEGINEEEIWVTSYRSAVVNVVEKNKRKKSKTE